MPIYIYRNWDKVHFVLVVSLTYNSRPTNSFFNILPSFNPMLVWWGLVDPSVISLLFYFMSETLQMIEHFWQLQGHPYRLTPFDCFCSRCRVDSPKLNKCGLGLSDPTSLLMLLWFGSSKFKFFVVVTVTFVVIVK